ncbi:MAG: hypothetical protein V3V19_00525 [Cocleimonas sp.]
MQTTVIKTFIMITLMVISTLLFGETSYGSYKKNNAQLPIKDFIYHWNESKKVLTIIQTPSLLSDTERSDLKAGKNEFMVLFKKETPNEERWQWYPYIVTEITFKTNEIKPSTIKSFYIASYGVEKKNHTDNFNSVPSSTNLFNKIGIKDGKLSISYSGESKMMDDSHSWSMNIQ